MAESISKRPKIEKDATIHPPFELVVAFIPCYDLPKLAPVCKEWRAIARKSYWSRADTPWLLPTSENESAKKIHYDSAIEPELSKLNSLRTRNQRTPYLALAKQGGDKWRLQPDGGDQHRSPPDPVLAMLPMEKDLPSLLCSPSTKLYHYSFVRGLLLIIVSHPWSPAYAKGLNESGMQDNYQWFSTRHPELMENEEDFDDFEEDDEDDPAPGSDLWGLLYDTKKDGTDRKLVDVKRLTQVDFEYFLNFDVERSANGRVVCLETGIRNGQRCSPNIITLTLSSESGIQLQTPLIWPSPDGLEDTYGSYMALTPSGDYLWANYGDLENMNGQLLYKLSADSANKGTRSWKLQWEDEDSHVEGFFTIDGDFVLTLASKQNVPGPLAAKRVYVVGPSEYWLKQYKETT